MGEYCRTAVFEPAGAGGFVVTCPAFPGLVTAGGTMEEARTMLTLKAGGKVYVPVPSHRLAVKKQPATPITEE